MSDVGRHQPEAAVGGRRSAGETDFSAAVHHRDGSGNGSSPGRLAIVEMHGQLDGTAVTAMDAAWQEATAEPVAAVVLDFGPVSYVNSTGIALVVALLAKAWKAGVEVRAYGVTDHYRHIFEITRLTDYVSIFPDEESAVGAAPSPVG